MVLLPRWECRFIFNTRGLEVRGMIFVEAILKFLAIIETSILLNLLVGIFRDVASVLKVSSGDV